MAHINRKIAVLFGAFAIISTLFLTTAPAFAQDQSVDPYAPVNGGSGDVNCGLDKIATIDEVSSAGPQRIEVGGGGTQHHDYYPDRGIRTISYVVGPQEPVIWMGFGSIWEGQCDQSQFDYVADAAGYARGSDWQPGRLDNGHSGLVIDTRVCALYDTLWNSLGTDQQNQRLGYIDGLLAAHRASQTTVLCPDLSSVDVLPYDVTGAAPVGPDITGSNPVGPDCAAAVRLEDHNPVNGQMWTPVVFSADDNGWRVINFWTNTKGYSQGERKLLLSPETTPDLMGGGSVWGWPGSCGDAALDNFLHNNGNPPVVSNDPLTVGVDQYVLSELELLRSEKLTR